MDLKLHENCFVYHCIGWSRPIVKANSFEPLIEVGNSLNKLKNNDKIHDILDKYDGYLILRGYLIKTDKDLLETKEKLPAEESEINYKDEIVQGNVLIELKNMF